MYRFSELSYNKRQLKLMLIELSDFCSNKSSLQRLSQSIRGLLSAIEQIEPSWRDDVLEEWGALEAVNALWLDAAEQGAVANLTPELDTTVLEAVARLKDLVGSQLID